MRRNFWRWIWPVLILVPAALFLAPRLQNVRAADILCRAPAHPLGAAVFLLALYAGKGLSFFLPLAVLEAASGLLFPMPWALALNTLGIACATSLPFFLGRRGRSRADALLRRFPKLRRVRELRAQSGDFLCVLLVRLAGGLPCDAVSLTLGAAGLDFRRYLLGGLLGMAPHMIAATVLGAALCDPGSQAFFISLAVNAAISVAALTVWRVRNLRRAAGRRPPD